MTSIIYDDKHFALSIKGHAGYGESGKDIVCASVSILAMTLGATLLKMASEGKLQREAIVDMSKGDVYIQVYPQSLYLNDCKIIFDSICEGFALLSKNYPENVQYICRNDLI